MRRMLCLVAAALCLTVPAQAQELPVMKRMTLELAQKIAQEALTACRAAGYRCSIRIVDEANIEKASLRDDGASPVTMMAATLKTNTVMLYGRASGPAMPVPPGTQVPPLPIPNTLNARGGLPIKVGDQIIGAIGISANLTPGRTAVPDFDTVFGTTALEKVAGSLK